MCEGSYVGGELCRKRVMWEESYVGGVGPVGSENVGWEVDMTRHTVMLHQVRCLSAKSVQR